MDIKEINLKFESDNKIIKVGKRDSFRLLKIEGIASGEGELYTNNNVMSDGSNIANSKIKHRSIMVEFEFVGVDTEKKRKKIISFFNIHKNGRLTIDYGGKEYQITYRPESFKSRIININNPLKALVDLYCPNPYFRSPNLTIESLAPFVELFEFPSNYWEQGGDGDLYFEVGFEGEKRALTVHGDGEVPVQIKFYGPSTNPVIRNNTTGEFIKVNKELSSDDILFIDTDIPSVEINGENAYRYIDINSTFWKMKLGSNEIEYTADTGVADAELEIIWNERYLGV